MAELTIRLVVDPETGARRVVVDYGSDADALPMEHEADHRALVEALVEGGLDGVEVGRAEKSRPAERSAERSGEAVAAEPASLDEGHD
jgi:predicted metal-dependent phosphoesterase TrpH